MAKRIDLGFGVDFGCSSFPLEDIETWVHEFSELAIFRLLKEEKCWGIILTIPQPSGKSTQTWVGVPHVMMALHTITAIIYTDGSTRIFTPNEFADEICFKGAK